MSTASTLGAANQEGTHRTTGSDEQPVWVRHVNAGYWRVTFNNPPINLFDPDIFASLRAAIGPCRGR